MSNNIQLPFTPKALRGMLAGALVVIASAGFSAQAGDILRGGAAAGVPGAVPVYGATSASTAKAQVHANDTLARTTQALTALQAMQAAARNIALSGGNNAGADPNHPGNQLPIVLNGLVNGGLVPDSGLSSQGTANPVTTWSGAGTPTQTTNGSQTTVNVTQTMQQAILNWKSFNIGKNTTLNIDQSAGGQNAGQWIAFNIVNDPSAVPSQILGSIHSIGQIYVINQNGIIFGGSSQVNVNTLVASSLPINTNLIARGLLNNPDEQFLFSQLPINQGANGTPAFTPPASYLPGGRDGDVTVQAGASITSPANAENVGGKVALIGYNVNNAGTISTPGGQTILAAGKQIAFAAHPSTDSSLRGLDVFVGAVDGNSGVATNSGLIEAPEADVTITGKNVNQFGIIDSLTTVTLNGRVDLLADYNAVSNTSFNSTTNPNVPLYVFQSTGNVDIGPGSVIRILPDLTSGNEVVGTQLALPSLVNIRGESIHMESGAEILAPGASLPTGAGAVVPLSNIGVTSAPGGLSAGITLNAGAWSFTNPGNSPRSQFVFTSGQIYIDAGAEINAAGSAGVSASVAQNIVAAQLLGPELADSPLQRQGLLRGQTVNVDILQSGVYNGQTWIGTPVANVSGYANLVEHTAGELTVNGGSVTLSAGDSIIMQQGSGLDVSGGWINYQGAMVQTTKLISGGHIYDISEAPPNIVYTAVLNGFTVNDPKWGVSQTFDTPLLGGPYYEDGYVQGGNGGSISVTAPAMALDGDLAGNTFAGPRQRVIAPSVSALALNFQAQAPLTFLSVFPTNLNIIFQEGSSLPAAAPFAFDGSGLPVTLSAARKQEVDLSPDLLTSDGFGSLTLNSDGNITIPSNVALTTQVNGSITMIGANVDIEGKIISPGGNISITVNDLSLTALAVLQVSAFPVTPPADPTRGNFTLGPSASLSTAGLVVDDLPSSAAPNTLPLVNNENGGSILINAFNANLAAGSSVDVSGGVAVSMKGKISYGAGGFITIKAGLNPNVPSTQGGRLVLDSTLSGYSGGAGGSLTLQAPLIQIGGAAGNPDTLLLAPGFFSQGGFDNFTLNGVGESVGGLYYQDLPGVLLTPGTVLAPVAENSLAVVGATGVTLTRIQQEAGVRKPVNLSFNALGVIDLSKTLLVRGDVVMGAGSSIQLDPGGSVTMNGNTVAVLGSITAPGGAITISGGKNSISLFSPGLVGQAVPTVDIGPSSVLSVAGTVVLTPDLTGNGYVTGSVLNGGNISVSGNIVAEAGAILDVSGASGVLDMPASYSQAGSTSTSGGVYIPTLVESNGGSITLAGAQELFTAATLIGNSGGLAARGGSLTISSGRFYNSSTLVSSETPKDITLTLTQGGISFHYTGASAIGNPILDAGNTQIAGQGYFAADDFNNHGFDALSLRGSIQFSGQVTVVANASITITSNSTFGTGIVLTADPATANSSLTLTAPYVDLGTFLPPLNLNNPSVTVPVFTIGDGVTSFTLAPTFGTGSVAVNAVQLIDVGNVSMQGIGSMGLNVAQGDLRGDGTLDLRGNVSITAGQIYPPTDAAFNIFAYDHGGTPGMVTILGGAARQLPLSAGGRLSIYASNINQGGVLRAPLGGIILGWDGTGAAPSDPLAGNTIAATPTLQLNLSAGSITSVSAIDPITGQGLVVPYGIILNGNSWIDPNGLDITTAGNGALGLGLPLKSVNISANNVAIDQGASIDIRGGGDMFAYRFVSGIGGNTDILGSASSFAILPGYQPDYAPFAPFTTIADQGSSTNQLNGDAGYINSNLHVGDQIYLQANNGLPAGTYTLLPARYALLPGALLVTPQSGPPVPTGSVLQADGSSIVAGYALNTLNPAQTGRPLFANFEVDSRSVVQARAQYDSAGANAFFAQSALSNNIAIPRLPLDSGQLVMLAAQTLVLNGAVNSIAPAGGRGGLVDISSPADILIAGPNASTSGFTGLVLDSTSLSDFGAESLLIGGVRQSGNGGTTVTVATNNITVDNSGASLAGPELILVARKSLTLDAGSEVTQTGATSGLDSTLLIGNATAGSADGVLLRVSSNPLAQLSRSGVDASTVPDMIVGAGVQISGVSVTLDSTSRTSFNPSAVLSGQVVNLDSGQISLQLNNPGVLQPTSGLVLSSAALQTLQAAAQSLSLLSYSSIDIYGTGVVGSPSFTSLSLHFSEIRGFNNAGGTVTFQAQNILLDDSPVGAFRTIAAGPQGTLEFDAGVIRLGVSGLNVDQYASQLGTQPGSQASANLFDLNQYIDQYSQVNLNATGGILIQQSNTPPQGQSLQGAVVTGVLNAQGNLTISTPVITGVTGANETIIATGAVNLLASPGNTPSIDGGGLGATLALQGAGVTVAGNITLASGQLTLHATSGNVEVANGADIEAGGIAKAIFDATEYSSGGQVNLISDTGNVSVDGGAIINVSAQSGAGNAGMLNVSAPAGSFSVDAAAQLLGQGGAGGLNGEFSLDAGTIANFDQFISVLEAGHFTQSITVRDRNDSLVVIDNVIKAGNFSLSTDNGSINVTGTVDASGMTGGAITLTAHNNVIIGSNAGTALLTVAGQYYNDAGQGGAITLEAGDETNGSAPVAVPGGNTFTGNGYLDIQASSELDLGVAHQLTTSDLALGNTTDNRPDLFTGILHLRAPQTAAGTDVQINPINGTINGASVILVEGYRIFDLTASGGAITSTVENNIKSNGNTFAGVAGGAATPGFTAMQNRLFSGANAGLASTAEIEPGAEIINRTGDLTLAGDWNLQSFRFGPRSVAGDLTLRAAGNLVFNGALSDGFDQNQSLDGSLWQSLLMSGNPLLPANAQSWSYRLTAGGDFSAADYHNVLPMAQLGANSGSLLLGLNAGTIALLGGANAQTSTAVEAGAHGFFQVIRTGAGGIDISTGRDVQLLNQFATIYTAGSQAPLIPNFDYPQLYSDPDQIFNIYPAQYSFGGGNVNVTTQGSILHLTKNNFNTLIADSERQLPVNWLYRRGYVGAGQVFGNSIFGDVASTTWWIDFSNFFEGVGALGGGNVTMKAGRNIENVDAVVPTNAWMPGYVNGSPAAPDAAALVEVGGGDLNVLAANNINAGVYYVERGDATLTAGNSILTNATRAPFPTNLTVNTLAYPASTWLPTTLFLGKGNFDVSALNNVLMGPVVNPFLLPAGVGNTFWYKTYFSTYAPGDTVSVSSLAGDVTLREGLASPIVGTTPLPILEEWMQYISFIDPSANTSAALFQPWLRVDETDLTSFASEYMLMPPTLNVTAFTGNVNLEGNFNLSPSPTGNLALYAGGSVNALQVVGSSGSLAVWSTSAIDVSDANPASIPGVATPFGYQTLVGGNTDAAPRTLSNFLSFVSNLFNESGATSGAASVLQTRSALHTPGLLHAGDPVPVQIYAGGGSISGLTLFSPKFSNVAAAQDITDIAFYIQNNAASDVSTVSAGRNLTAYNPFSSLRELASKTSAGNKLSTTSQTPLAGDIQISGPGTLEVLAGHDLTLGQGLSNADGTALGITSIGNQRDPFLPFGGADIIAGSGIGLSSGLDDSQLDFADFIAQFIEDPVNGAIYLPELAKTNGSPALTPQSFSLLSPAEQNATALQVFYLVLRDAGRNHGIQSSPGFGNYDAGLAAIAALFPGSQWQGNIDITSREIKTVNGGNISLFAPGGGVTLGNFPVSQVLVTVNPVTQKKTLTVTTGNSATNMGIVTQAGGNIGIFAMGNVDIGTQRIFTLAGGNEIIWSSKGNIAAGASSKTVQSAPPTRVLIDPQSASVETDLSGLATGGGIGVLQTTAGAAASDVDLIAPEGTVDAGDAGIRVSGNLNIAAVQVLNATNISVGGVSVGTPAAPSAPNVGAITQGSQTGGAGSEAARQIAQQQTQTSQPQQQESPSTITVEVIGYGGGDGDQTLNDPAGELRKKNPAARRKETHAPRESGINNEPPLALNAGAQNAGGTLK